MRDTLHVDVPDNWRTFQNTCPQTKHIAQGAKALAASRLESVRPTQHIGQIRRERGRIGTSYTMRDFDVFNPVPEACAHQPPYV